MKKTTLRIALVTALTGFTLLNLPALGIASSLQASGSATAATKKTTTRPATSPQEISDAKTKGLVWVNTSTHVYHRDSSSLYGNTKRGKFMTEDDAKKAGYRAANDSGMSKKGASTMPASQK